MDWSGSASLYPLVQASSFFEGRIEVRLLLSERLNSDLDLPAFSHGHQAHLQTGEKNGSKQPRMI